MPCAAQARVSLTCSANPVAITPFKLMAPKIPVSKVTTKEKNNKAATAKAKEAVPNDVMEDYAFITDKIGFKIVVPCLMFVTVFVLDSSDPSVFDISWYVRPCLAQSSHS